MKNLKYVIMGAILAVASFLTGFLIRQPKINKLKKQLELLQRDNQKLITIITGIQHSYKELLVQHKALKALQFRKKSVIKEQLTENLIMQYAIKSYLTLLLKNGRYEKKLEKDEIIFFKAFEKVINGKELSTSDKIKIRDYVMKEHTREIKELKECDYTDVFKELENKSDN